VGKWDWCRVPFPQRLKPSSFDCPNRSGKPLRHPIAFDLSVPLEGSRNISQGTHTAVGADRQSLHFGDLGGAALQRCDQGPVLNHGFWH